MPQSYYNLPANKMLGRHYQIIAYLGCGYEGEVYKVEERDTGIIRAAKLFNPKRQLASKPLIRYAQKLYQLRSCPIVIQYHHRDTAIIKKQKVNFLVSEFVDGEMLSAFIARQKKKRLTTFEALHLFYAIVIGVEQIHFLGEYHGDIHSDNLIVRRNGLGFEVRLLDFLHLGRATKEQIQYDVYDLINLLYEMIGGKAAYTKTDKIIKQIICGRKHNLLRKKYNEAGHIRLFLENLYWD